MIIKNELIQEIEKEFDFGRIPGRKVFHLFYKGLKQRKSYCLHSALYMDIEISVSSFNDKIWLCEQCLMAYTTKIDGMANKFFVGRNPHSVVIKRRKIWKEYKHLFPKVK